MNVSESFLGPGLRRTLPQGRQSHHTSRESLQSTTPPLPPTGVRSAGQQKRRRKGRQRLRLLDAVGLDAVLLTRSRRFPPRDLQRPPLLPRQTGASRHCQGTNKSTLSYANEHRPAQLYEDFVLHRAQPVPRRRRIGTKRKKKFRFKNKSVFRSTRPLFRCARSCSRGPSFAGPRAASRHTSCWTTMITCRATC